MAKQINLENFFTEDREREGVWHEAMVDDKSSGLEFLLVGIHSEYVAARLEEIDKQSDEVRSSDLTDEEKIEKLEELDADRVAVLTKNIRAKDGSELMIDGKPIIFSEELAKEFYKKCPSIKMDNIDFVLKSSSFMILD